MRATQQGFDSGHELPIAEWFGEIIIGSDVEAIDFVLFFRFGCKHQDREGFIDLTDLATNLQSIESGEHEIQYHQIIMVTHDLVECFPSVFDDVCRGWEGSDLDRYQLCKMMVIFYY